MFHNLHDALQTEMNQWVQEGLKKKTWWTLAEKTKLNSVLNNNYCNSIKMPFDNDILFPPMYEKTQISSCSDIWLSCIIISIIIKYIITSYRRNTPLKIHVFRWLENTEPCNLQNQYLWSYFQYRTLNSTTHVCLHIILHCTKVSVNKWWSEGTYMI